MPLASRGPTTAEWVTEPHSEFSLDSADLQRIENGLCKGGGGVAALEDGLLGVAGHFGGFNYRAALLELGDDRKCLPIEFHGGEHANVGREASPK